MINKIIEIKFGSHLYGTDTENSDLDLKCIYLPTKREILLGSYKKTIQTNRPKREYERNNKDDVDLEILSLDRYIDLLLQGQTMALDMLFSPSSNYTDFKEEGLYVMNYLKMHRQKFLNKNVNAFVGYAKQQAAKYGQKGFRIHAIKATLEKLENIGPFDTFAGLDQASVVAWLKSVKNENLTIEELDGPNGTKIKHLNVAGRMYPFTAQVRYWKQQLQKRYDEYGHRAILAEKNEGIDWKALSHAVRVNSEAYELLTTSTITFPRPDRQLLLDIKLGRVKYAEVAEIIEQGLVDLETASKTSELPNQPDRKFAEDFIVEMYENICLKGVN